MTSPHVITCGGRAYDRDGRPIDEECGRRAPDRADPFIYSHLDVLRAAGWRIGPQRVDGTHDAMCPRCARPDPTLTALCRTLTKGPTAPC